MRSRSLLLLTSITALIILAAGFSYKKNPLLHTHEFTKETPVEVVLKKLGEPYPLHYIETIPAELAAKGEEIIRTGRTTGPDGKLTQKQSKHFVCTDCHNTSREDPDLSVSDPVARLAYVEKNNLKFLPSSSFFGIVNRTNYYGGDYKKKYGTLVDPVHDTLVNAIQLCATECSQGRALVDWEMKAVVAYFHTLQLKLGDLEMSEKEFNELNHSTHATQDQVRKIIAVLKKKYLHENPATFLDPPAVAERKYGEGGNAETGAKIYKYSCMHCHADGRVTNFTLDYDKTTFRYLKRKMKRNDHFSVYYMVRKGNYSVPGHKPYMPNFTKERMSGQQLEDLAAYIVQQAK
jgi:mono/diheme cytochrome c family protein